VFPARNGLFLRVSCEVRIVSFLFPARNGLYLRASCEVRTVSVFPARYRL
jgi:hypothetical protein